jgi:hypothetical protein
MCAMCILSGLLALTADAHCTLCTVHINILLNLSPNNTFVVKGTV